MPLFAALSPRTPPPAGGAGRSSAAPPHRLLCSYFMPVHSVPTVFEILPGLGSCGRLLPLGFSPPFFPLSTTIVLYASLSPFFGHRMAVVSPPSRRKITRRNQARPIPRPSDGSEFQTVQIFRQEEHSGQRYDAALHAYERARPVRGETTLELLNLRPGPRSSPSGLVPRLLTLGDRAWGRRRPNDGRRLVASQRLPDPL